MDFLGLSDPYVKLSLSGDGMTARKTSIKKKNLNPEWNESFKLTVKDPDSQFLHLDVLDWDKVCHLPSCYFFTSIAMAHLSSFNSIMPL